MEIKIGKMARACSGCERPFVHDEELNSLVRLESQELVREDYCAACWRRERAEGAFSAWSRRYYDPKVAEQEPPEKFSPLRQAFYEAVEGPDRLDMATAYLAAQLLRRQKVFRLVKESDDTDGETRIALFSDRIGNHLIEVRDPNLTFAEMEEGRQVLIARLSELEAGEPLEPGAEDAESYEAEARSG